MSRTRRCAPDVEERLVALSVAPAPWTGFLATLTAARSPGPEHEDPVVVTGEGETVARAVGAAEAAAWRALQPGVKEPTESAVDRRQLQLVAGQEEG